MFLIFFSSIITIYRLLSVEFVWNLSFVYALIVSCTLEVADCNIRVLFGIGALFYHREDLDLGKLELEFLIL